MHDDQIRSLLRTLEADHEPDPAFADALYGRLRFAAAGRPRSRTPMLLAAAALLALLAAGVAVGAGLIPLPLVLDPDPGASASAQPSSAAVASPTVQPPAESPAPSVTPAASASVPDSFEGRVAMTMADGLAIREEPATDGALVRRVNAGQPLGILDGPVEVEGLQWYRVGPGALTGWVTKGPAGDWLSLVEDGAVGFVCDGGCGAAALVGVTPFGDFAITAIAQEAFGEWAWSPDGTRIAATSDGGDAGQAEIVVMDADGSNRRSLGAGYGPAWSPDGSLLAWSTGSAIVVTDAELGPTELDLEVRSPGNPMWSPDGQSLAFSAIDCPECPADEPIIGDPPVATWLVGADGTGLRQLTGGDYSGLVDWSPDGSTLAFIQFDLSAEFPTRAYTLPAAGGERSYLPEPEAITAAPAWSPSGAHLAYGTQTELVVALSDGSAPRVVATAPESGFGSVAWSPSGEWLLYASLGTADGDGPAIWIAPFDGSGSARQLSPSGASARSPGWQPVLGPLP